MKHFALDLVPAFCAFCFVKSTRTAFSSYSDLARLQSRDHQQIKPDLSWGRCGRTALANDCAPFVDWLSYCESLGPSVDSMRLWVNRQKTLSRQKRRRRCQWEVVGEPLQNPQALDAGLGWAAKPLQTSVRQSISVSLGLAQGTNTSTHNPNFGPPTLPPTSTQKPRQWGFSKGGFCRVHCHGQGNKKYPRILGPAVHLALRAPKPREAYILQKPHSKNPLFLVPDLLNPFLHIYPKEKRIYKIMGLLALLLFCW